MIDCHSARFAIHYFGGDNRRRRRIARPRNVKNENGNSFSSLGHDVRRSDKAARRAKRRGGDSQAQRSQFHINHAQNFTETLSRVRLRVLSDFGIRSH